MHIQKEIKLAGSVGEEWVLALFDTVTAKDAIRLDFYIDGYRFSDEFMIVEGLSEDVIIGVKTMQAWRLKLDLEKDQIIIDPRTQKLRLMNLILFNTSFFSVIG